MVPPRNSSGSSAKFITRPVTLAESERRLRPVIEVLYESHNPRQAIKLLAKAENKRPGWPAARALRAVALLRLGRRLEADDLAATIVDDLANGRVPADEDAATKLHLFYREMPGRELLSAQVYEIVARADEEDILLSESSFVYQLHARDFTSAQKVATRLQRMSSRPDSPRPKEEYALWMAAALYCGSRLREHEPKLLKLAVAVADRAMGSLLQPTAEFVRFATKLFCATQNFATAASVVEKQNLVMDREEQRRLQADIRFQSQESSKAFGLYQSLLFEGDSDDWSNWLRLINLSDDDETVLNLVKEICVRTESPSSRPRACYLAKLEVLHRRRSYEALMEGILQYFEVFGDKSACALDLRPYVAALGRGSGQGIESRLLEEFCSKLNNRLSCGIDGRNEAAEHECGQRHINICWIRLWLGCLSGSVQEFFRCFMDMLVEKIEPSERQPGDDYLLLGAHRLLPVPISSSDRYSCTCAVVRTIILVEAGLIRSPFNFHFKLLLLRLYGVIGSCKSAFEIWSSLDVKHIQIETLGHLILRPLFDHGLHDQLLKTAVTFDRLRTECDRDLPENISRAFSTGSLNAAVEFIEFRERLERSSSSYLCLYLEAVVYIVRSQFGTDGIEKAWTVVGDESRISDEFIAGKWSLVQNQDERCMMFWDINEFDSEECRKDFDLAASEVGTPLCRELQTELLCDLLVLRCILRVARGNILSTKHGNNNGVNPSNSSRIQDAAVGDLQRLRITIKTEQDSISRRMHYMYNLVEILYQLTSQPIPTEHNSNAQSVAETSKLHVNVDYLKTAPQQWDSDVTRISSLEAPCISPRSLRALGQFTHETLALTSVALTSMSGYSMKCKPVKGDSTDTLVSNVSKENAKRVISDYVEAALSAAEMVLTLVSPAMSYDREWSTACNDGKCNSSANGHVAGFSSDAFLDLDLEYSDESGTVRSSRDLCEIVQDKILASHHTSVGSIIASLQSTIQRLKLMSI